MLLLSNSDIASVLDMRETIDALRTGYSDLARGMATYGPRIDFYLPTGSPHDYHQWGSMVGGSVSSGVLAVRMKSDMVSWPGGETQEKHCVRPGLYCGLVMLFAISDGAPLALLQDGYLQHLRVGAAAAIGAEALARRDATTLGLLGSGGMARSFLQAFALVRNLDVVRVFSPTPAHRNDFADEMSRLLQVPVIAVSDPEAAVHDASLVASATDSLVPTFDPAWLSPGSHVTCVTRRELGDTLLARADMVVQLGTHSIPHGVDMPTLEWKAGGIASYVAGSPEDRARIPPSRPSADGVYPTLLDVQTGASAGRTSAEQITLFVATGTQGLQFASVGGRAFKLASARGLGHHLPDEWLLQDIRD